jgi:hypothetical protein
MSKPRYYYLETGEMTPAALAECTVEARRVKLVRTARVLARLERERDEQERRGDRAVVMLREVVANPTTNVLRRARAFLAEEGSATARDPG